MDFILGLALTSIQNVWLTLQHNWPFLLVSIIIAVLLKLYVNAEKVSGFLNRYRGAVVVAATAAAVATPLCSCGTTAVILGMMATSMPWAPIIAFMVASPLTSPEELVYSAGLFGWPFALAFYLASIVLGLAGGWLAAVIEKRGWLANQSRFAQAAPAVAAVNSRPSRVFGLDVPAVSLRDEASCCGQSAPTKPAAACGCGQAVPAIPEMIGGGSSPVTVVPESSCGCGQPAPITPVSICSCSAPELEQQASTCGCGSASATAQTDAPAGSKESAVTPAMIAKELFDSGKRLLFMFVGFAFIGYFLNGLIPASWMSSLFGGGHIYGVPLAATLGLPFYINSETSLPLIRAMLEGGMSQGAALAFLIAGAGTSIGAITGALTIARWRVVGLVIGVLWVGAILSGYAYNLALSLHLF